MRFYQNFKEAVDEIRRDLAEMGIDVHPQTMQDKFVADNPEYATKELQNYIYTVFKPLESIGDLQISQPWAGIEFNERISGKALNPGTAYLQREEIWKDYLHDGKFSYTYPERMFYQVQKIIDELKEHPDSRQLYLSIWDPCLDIYNLGGGSRVPCSLGYLFQYRRGQLDVTYFMRSCDFVTHLQNDAYLAVMLMGYIANEAGVSPGNFTHFMGSLHVYAKDVKGVF